MCSSLCSDSTHPGFPITRPTDQTSTYTNTCCQTTNSTLWDSQDLVEGGNKDAYTAGIKAFPQLQGQKGDRDMCLHLLLSQRGVLLLTTWQKSQDISLQDNRSSFKIEMNWLKPILVLMEGDHISIPCNIHQLFYAKKRREKMLSLIHSRPAPPVPQPKSLHTDNLERINP